MFVSSSPRVRVLLVLAALFNMSAYTRCSTIPRAELDQEILYKELEDLQNVVDDAILSNIAEQSSESASEEAPDLPDDVSLLLRALLSAAVNGDVTGRKPLPLPEGRALTKRFGFKRGFDSISQNSGFGMHRGSFGGSNGGAENLTFTFESLFPAIARGLRSTRK